VREGKDGVSEVKQLILDLRFSELKQGVGMLSLGA
jgi:hypothetical protein